MSALRQYPQNDQTRGRGKTMTDNLFETPETLSPRLAWMREHGIELRETSLGWLASSECGSCRFGDTDDGALARLAWLLNLKLWNQ
jgi:hypothetical protein